MVTIPMKDFSSFKQEITLDNVPYIFFFNWISRDGFYTFDMNDREGNTLIAGVKLLVDFEFISRYPDRGLPPGELYVIDQTGNSDRIGRYDFVNGRLSLIYITEEEVLSGLI
ncbi:hypothetical protein DRQ25_07850 [Candidatus Fermentibacteria bacterium]|nr:MAG: hypothetical protein DRQ25_07850 [Candidatus Fermentibacteria bacterium]